MAVFDFPVDRAQTSEPNPFRELWQLGYKNLIPIIPPKSPISSRSGIAKRLAVGDDPRGKVPGIRWPDGSWSGFDWLAHQADEIDCERWRRMRAGVGIKTGDGLVAIDADIFGDEHAALVRAEIEQRFGVLPTRIGRSPKAIYVARIEGPLAYCRVEFGELGPKGTRQQRVEILTKGKQFVAYGVHPGTMAPYRWTQRLVAYADLPLLPASGVVEFLDALRGLLPNTGPLVREGGLAAVVDQEKLRGSLETVSAAVRATPNNSERFATRESYLSLGYAIKAALPDDADAAFGLFEDWCDRWTGGRNEPETTAADWARMKAPFRRGAGFLYKTAVETSGGVFTRAAPWFEAVPEPEPSVFGEHVFGDPGAALAMRDESAFTWVTADSFEGVDAPAQEWLVEGLIPARVVTLIAGDGGTGKSLLTLQLAAATASGSSWIGLPVARGGALFLTAEDEIDECHRRLKAAAVVSAEFGLRDLGGLAIVSLDGEDAVLSAPDRSGQMVATRVFKRLRETVLKLRPRLLVLDTLADLFGGDEIKRTHTRQFICLLRGLIRETGLTIVLLAHPSMSGMASGSGTSGSTAWNNSVRSRLYLKRRVAQGGVEQDADIRTLTTMKANRAKIGDELVVRYRSGVFMREIEASEIDIAARESTCQEVFLALLAATEREGRNVSHNARAPNYAPAAFAEHPRSRGFGRDDFKQAMEKLFGAEIIKNDEFGPPAKRRSRLIQVGLTGKKDLFS